MKTDTDHLKVFQVADSGRERGVSELAAARIRQGIVAGELRPGEHLSDRELCEMTGVSRAAVREAIRTLASEGLVTLVRYRGPIVAQLSEKEVRDLYDLRALLEGHCAALFVQRASNSLVAALDASVQDIGRGHEEGNMIGVIEASNRYYAILAEGADNGAISKALETLLNRMALFRFSSTRWPGRAERSMMELREIIAAVEARNLAAASKAAQIHVERAAEMALLIVGVHVRAETGGRR